MKKWIKQWNTKQINAERIWIKRTWKGKIIKTEQRNIFFFKSTVIINNQGIWLLNWGNKYGEKNI